jgi:hypothetical protein
MAVEDIVERVRRLVDEVWNEHDAAAISEYFDGWLQEEISGHYEPFAGAPATGKVRIVGLDPHLPPVSSAA